MNSIPPRSTCSTSGLSGRSALRAGVSSPRAPVPPCRQAPLRLSMSHRVPLVKLDTVIAARGESADTIYYHVENGNLRWVFNMATNYDGGIRDLRFWNREIQAFAGGTPGVHASLRAAGVDAVVNEILGDRAQFHSGELCLLLGIRRPTLMLLRDELLTAGRQFFHRHSLERFLKRRLQ